MATDDGTVPVVFRTWRREGDTIALFPMLDESRGRCLSYQHVGQHGAADYAHVVRVTRPATSDEISPLRAELERIGYRVRVLKRAPGHNRNNNR